MPFPFDPHPATRWTLTRDGRERSGVVVLVPNGVEVRINRDGGALLMSRVFADSAEALAWADAQRREFLMFDPTKPGEWVRID
jgi:hypothetical protein